MPETPRKTNQFITWFTGILKETRRGDILEDKAAKATIDTDESLYPRLPSVDGSEIELRMTEARGLGDPPLSEFQIIMQRMEQMELGKRALQAVVGAVQKEEVKTKNEKESYVQTWENNATPERLWIPAYAPAKRTLSEFKNAMVLGLCYCEQQITCLQFMP